MLGFCTSDDKRMEFVAENFSSLWNEECGSDVVVFEGQKFCDSRVTSGADIPLYKSI